MMGSYTKHQRTPNWQPKQCNNSWIAYPSGVTTPDLSLVQARHKHCGARLTTEQKANQCQQSHWMELWLNKLSEILWDPLWQNANLQKTCGNNSSEVQERSVSPEGYGCKGYWTTPPVPTVSKCGAQCHWLRTRPHNNVTDKSAKAGQSAERGNVSHTRNHPGHTHWDHEVHAKPTTNANQTESGAGQSILQCRWKSSQLHELFQRQCSDTNTPTHT